MRIVDEMSIARVTELMDRPTASFLIEPAHTEVRYCERSMAAPL